jgi:hypothetical protein
MPPWVAFMLGVGFAAILSSITPHIAPRRGAPSPATALRLLQERERALTQLVQQWQQWGMYVAGIASSEPWMRLPPMPGQDENR